MNVQEYCCPKWSLLCLLSFKHFFCSRRSRSNFENWGISLGYSPVSWGIFSHVTCFAQSRASENMHDSMKVCNFFQLKLALNSKRLKCYCLEIGKIKAVTFVECLTAGFHIRKTLKRFLFIMETRRKLLQESPLPRSLAVRLSVNPPGRNLQQKLRIWDWTEPIVLIEQRINQFFPLFNLPCSACNFSHIHVDLDPRLSLLSQAAPTLLEPGLADLGFLLVLQSLCFLLLSTLLFHVLLQYF